MTEQQKEFLRLAVEEQKSYDKIEEILGINRDVFSPWWDTFKKEREELSEIHSIWCQKCPDYNYYEFKKWYINADKACHYCGITTEQLSLLWARYPNLTKRKRGKKLEIDRREPNLPYNITDNLVFSCYWCNNAKTDTFSDTEFVKIGQIIKEIWRERLNDNR